ncbi:uncharacterized protein LOC114332159 [Diabrotica virgifera virgifera]|uniref:Uncharacterized protein LOC114332159 isoform X1 n=1 Tax=Diabrotica virgifera virgifera TaxID=50390 RepID=A0A6P7FNG9_DIAVI|nr:uncharacterized protein LOC114332159 [Diabrotica virgifera virgifera]
MILSPRGYNVPTTVINESSKIASPLAEKQYGQYFHLAVDFENKENQKSPTIDETTGTEDAIGPTFTNNDVTIRREREKDSSSSSSSISIQSLITPRATQIILPVAVHHPLMILQSKRRLPSSRDVTLKQAYKKKVGISEKKKADLLSLLEKKKNVAVMPQYYRDFYANL